MFHFFLRILRSVMPKDWADFVWLPLYFVSDRAIMPDSILLSDSGRENSDPSSSTDIIFSTSPLSWRRYSSSYGRVIIERKNAMRSRVFPFHVCCSMNLWRSVSMLP